MQQEYLNKVALVTGASRGIGRAVAKALALRGAKVLALGRQQADLETLDNEVRTCTKGKNHISIIAADVTKSDTVAVLAAFILKRFGHLDILVGNAAVLGVLTPLQHLTEQEFDKTLAVNLHSYQRLIRYTEPLLRQSAYARVVFLTSGVTTYFPPFWAAYSVSKAGLEALVKTWAAEIKNLSNIKVNLINPGPTKTAMRAAAFPSENPETLTSPEAIAEFILPYLAKNCKSHGAVIHYQALSIKKNKS